MNTMSNSEQKDSGIPNSELFKHIINSIYFIIKDKTSENYSIMIIGNIIKTIENKFEFLKYVNVICAGQLENQDGIIDLVGNIDTIAPTEIGKAIESIIRLTSLSMKDKEARRYFITELKRHIQESYLFELKKHNIDLDVIQSEQQNDDKQEQTNHSPPKYYYKIKPKDDKLRSFASLLNFAWDKVAFWEYKDNVCIVYDKKGNVLDRLPLDKIVKDYIIEMTGFNELPVNSSNIVELNEKEYEFINLLYSKDLDAEEAMKLLELDMEELSDIIRKLLVNEVLNYISYDKLMQSESGIRKLIEKK
ncbi:hypothetical protein AYK20_01165 [Thermoplasmatales archaeon SG8-52-1]|nr:MAG: hypothetical protein AYK20_01165 [Thermoplasmatales archaeon SG8-52-1]